MSVLYCLTHISFVQVDRSVVREARHELSPNLAAWSFRAELPQLCGRPPLTASADIIILEYLASERSISSHQAATLLGQVQGFGSWVSLLCLRY